jgi:hypothetical protein
VSPTAPNSKLSTVNNKTVNDKSVNDNATSFSLNNNNVNTLNKITLQYKKTIAFLETRYNKVDIDKEWNQWIKINYQRVDKIADLKPFESLIKQLQKENEGL